MIDCVIHEKNLFQTHKTFPSMNFLFVSTADWDNPYWTNKQHVAVELGRRGHKLLYVESQGLRRPTATGRDFKRIIKRLIKGLCLPRQVSTNVWVWSPITIPFQDSALIRGINKFVLKLYREKQRVSLKTNHTGNVYNSLAAATVVHLLGIGLPAIADGLSLFGGFEERFERRALKEGCGVLISDCYNASPESMRAALLAIDEIKASGKKIAILGDMLELGEKR